MGDPKGVIVVRVCDECNAIIEFIKKLHYPFGIHASNYIRVQYGYTFKKDGKKNIACPNCKKRWLPFQADYMLKEPMKQKRRFTFIPFRKK